jgi:hypothetical protein
MACYESTLSNSLGLVVTNHQLLTEGASALEQHPTMATLLEPGQRINVVQLDGLVSFHFL